ncbi:hypothetical protein Echvi_3800 [Echinicola vietnamensis DSM 17526]|uniref:Uncharacterized protein n=1 Tax=Echinicola vietnamensis (strain DSM 17526 / LMG 23754 / KMM 6221) TaxID=926556 RepID=L0G3D9_ECHVK|nr:hypothetical protein Echvi_3800 [Echinicola vietnamensis DSM 17526]
MIFTIVFAKFMKYGTDGAKLYLGMIYMIPKL